MNLIVGTEEWRREPRTVRFLRMGDSLTGTPLLESVESDNFKGLGTLRMRFASRLSVLIGANGVGKSSVLQQIELMGRLRNERRESPYSTSFRGVFTSEGLRGDPNLHLRIVLRGADTHALRVEIRACNQFAEPENFRCEMAAPAFNRAFDTMNSERNEDFFLSAELDWFKSKLLRLELGNLQRNSRAPTEAPSLESTGYGLPSVLAWLATTQRRNLDQLEQSVRTIVPDFEGVTVTPVSIAGDKSGTPEAGQALSVSFTHSRERVPAQHVSEGTLLILGVLAAAYSPGRPRLLLIEDLDRGLHPAAQKAFIEALRSILNAEKDLQIIGTTHSPYLLDHFNEPEVIVMKRSKEGQVLAKRFSEHPKWARSEPLMSVGEFWTAVGEDWVFGDGG